MQEPIVEGLLKELVRAESTPNQGEAAAAAVLAEWLAARRIVCRVDGWDDNRANVVARITSTGRRPGLLFVCHLDVVGPGEEAWDHSPFEAVEEKGRIYGRGTADMKGGIACVAAAIADVVNGGVELQGDVIFAATAGEETDSAGVLRFMEERTALPDLGGVVIPEPTDFCVVTAHRGLFWLKVVTRGKAVHSSMPERGVNAIMAMTRVLEELERYRIDFPPHPLLGSSAMSVNTIVGGEAMNIVPDRCSLGVDVRTLPGQDPNAVRYDIERILARLKAKVPQFEAELVVERTVGAIETDPQCEFVQTFCSAVDVDLTNAVGFTTDAPHLASLGAPIVIFGPGKPKLCHQADEYVDVADLHAAVAFFRKVIRALLS